MLVAEVAVPLPLRGAFSYVVPDHLAASVSVGCRVLCDFGKRQILGVVLELRDREPEATLRPLRAVVEATPVIPLELLAFLRELSAYYLAPIGEVMRLAVPALSQKSVERLRDAGELFADTALARTKRVHVPQEQWVSATAEVEVAGTLRGQAAQLLASLRAGGPQPMARLLLTMKSARVAARKLEGLGLVAIESREKSRTQPFAEAIPRDAAPELTRAQASSVERVRGALLGKHEPRAFLLFGVTGSGKTEVYLRAIADSLALGRGALVMVPEIALTPQLVSRYRARFGDDVAVIHSGLSDRSRHDMHERLRSGELRVAIGARSSLFAPVPELGLVIVDEEHDSSFKQEEGVRYHARDMALLRAHRAGATIVLGSATPSLETYALAQQGKLELLRLPDRAAETALLPDVTVVDLRHVGAGPSGHKKLSLPLHRAIDETLSRGEQVILFLNRRGHSPTVLCASCGHVTSCPQCSVALTLHLSRKPPADAQRVSELGGKLICHYCGFSASPSRSCESCGSGELLPEGLGTEKLEETIAAAFVGARVARLDRDVAEGKQAERILSRMREREIDILVGTQMVTKGHDYPFVTLVGVINADAALGLPDFRAAERAFSLLVQVAGRAGRHERAGRVLIQTYSPEHAAVMFAKRHDVEGFLTRELRDRAEVGYPPYSRLALVRVDSPEARAAAQEAERLAHLARGTGAVRKGDVEVLGPAPAPLARLRGRYRFRVMLRAKSRPALRSVLLSLSAALPRPGTAVRVAIDVDPVAML